MPIHDWTRVEDGTFHHFHTTWITHFSEALNSGVLPSPYYALAEQHKGRKIAAKARRTLTVRHTSGPRIIALIEILSPGNKTGSEALAEFVRKVVEALRSRIHVVVVDLLPPGRHDPQGIHAEIVEALSAETYQLPEAGRLTFAAYAAGAPPVAYLEHPAVGEEVPALPLFLASERYVHLALGPSYAAAYRGMPAFWRDVLEGRQTAPDAR